MEIFTEPPPAATVHSERLAPTYFNRSAVLPVPQKTSDRASPQAIDTRLLVSLRETYTLNRIMSITLQVPDSVARSLRLPESEVAERLRCELALSLYAQGILAFGKAVELAAISRYEFAALLARRGIPPQYGPEDLAEDLAYGGGE